MLQSSVSRRLACIRTSTSTITASRASITTGARCHQRRNSSSKPPIPPSNGSSPINSASVKHVGGPRTDKRPAPKRNARSKTEVNSQEQDGADAFEDVSRQWTRTLPSVPSTQHINPKDLYVASFFGIHRPISITGPLPPEASIQDIDKLFTAKPASQKQSNEVIYTLLSTVNQMEAEIDSQSSEEKLEIIKALRSNEQNGDNVHHLDGQQNIKVSIRTIAKDFRPYRVPPPPVPMAEYAEQSELKIQPTREEAKAEADALQPTREETKAEAPYKFSRDQDIFAMLDVAIKATKQLHGNVENVHDLLKRYQGAIYDSRTATSEFLNLLKSHGASREAPLSIQQESLTSQQRADILQALATYTRTFRKASELRDYLAKYTASFKKTTSGVAAVTRLGGIMDTAYGAEMHDEMQEVERLLRPYKDSEFDFSHVFQPTPAASGAPMAQAASTQKNSFFTPSFSPTSSRRTKRGMLSVSDSAIRNARIPGIERVNMYLISVKRQRRLKMKKHKYKKLQRATRNLRRRQGKI